MCYWNTDTNTRNILYTSPAITSGGCLESNGLDPQLQFTSVTSTDLPLRVPALDLRPHTCHQFGYRLFSNYRKEHIKRTETYRRELRLHLGSWPRRLYQGSPQQANPRDGVQETLGLKLKPPGSYLPAAAQSPLLSQRCSWLRSLPTSLWHPWETVHVK